MASRPLCFTRDSEVWRQRMSAERHRTHMALLNQPSLRALPLSHSAVMPSGPGPLPLVSERLGAEFPSNTFHASRSLLPQPHSHSVSHSHTSRVPPHDDIASSSSTLASVRTSSSSFSATAPPALGARSWATSAAAAPTELATARLSSARSSASSSSASSGAATARSLGRSSGSRSRTSVSAEGLRSLPALGVRSHHHLDSYGLISPARRLCAITMFTEQMSKAPPPPGVR